MISLQRSVGISRMAMQFMQHRSLISTPPTVKVSFGYKLFGAVALTVSILGIPTYIAVNIKNYRQE